MASPFWMASLTHGSKGILGLENNCLSKYIFLQILLSDIVARSSRFLLPLESLRSVLDRSVPYDHKCYMWGIMDQLIRLLQM